MIFDDLPVDYISQYQAEDRIHRIDNIHKKYEVNYYSMVPTYSEEFLEEKQDSHVAKREYDDRMLYDNE